MQLLQRLKRKCCNKSKGAGYTFRPSEEYYMTLTLPLAPMAMYMGKWRTWRTARNALAMPPEQKLSLNLVQVRTLRHCFSPPTEQAEAVGEGGVWELIAAE